MADIVTPEKRSRMMSGIRSANTRPELLVRRALHRLGYRYRLHGALPGRPDLVFPGRRCVIFVHGCFWHGHDCHLFRLPSTRADFWSGKIEANRVRDRATEAALIADGWRVLLVWECALRGRSRLAADAVPALCDAWLQAGAAFEEIRGTDRSVPESSGQHLSGGLAGADSA